MTSLLAEVSFHLWKLPLFLSVTFVQCADIQCEIQTTLLKITLELLNLESHKIIGNILKVVVQLL